MNRALTVIFVMIGFYAASPASAGADTISWRVENPFRFFSDPQDTALHRYAASVDGSVLTAERWLAKRHTYGWAEDMFLETCWHLLRQDHSGCGDLDSYINPASHRVLARFSGHVADNATCVWNFAAASGRTAAARSQSQPCANAIRVDVPYPEGGRLRVSIDGREVAQTTIRVDDQFIVGLGDSYASGEGNPDRPVRWQDHRAASFGQIRGLDLSGYPRRQPLPIAYEGRRMVGPSAFWLSQPCHRSLYSHQLRVALQLAVEDPHRAVTFLGLSCSGAEITSGLLTAWKGVERFVTVPRRSQIGRVAIAQCGGHGFEMRNYNSSFTDGGQVPSLNGLALERCPPRRAREIDLVLLSIGGNDIGFAELVAYSILRDQTPLRRFSEAVGEVSTPREARARFPELKSRFKLLRRALHNHLHIPWDEPQRIVLTAYPHIAIEEDGQSVCGRDNAAGLDGFPGYRLDRRRTAEAEAVSDELNTLLQRVARAYGWTFVAAHRDRFAGRGICAGVPNGGRADPDELTLPRWTGETWMPYPPSMYRPYASRKRWMRTSNDAFLTAHIDVSSDLRRQLRPNGRYQPTDLLKASTFGGAFHPTAEGQAAIADAVLYELRGRLVTSNRR